MVPAAKFCPSGAGFFAPWNASSAPPPVRSLILAAVLARLLTEKRGITTGLPGRASDADHQVRAWPATPGDRPSACPCGFPDTAPAGPVRPPRLLPPAGRRE